MNFGANPIQLVLLDSVFLENLGELPPKIPPLLPEVPFLSPSVWLLGQGHWDERSQGVIIASDLV